MKTILHITVVLFIMLLTNGCNDDKQVKVEYEASLSVSKYSLSFMDDTGTLKELTIEPEGADDVWRYSMIADEGDIVYVSGKYNDINSALRLNIKIDGKIYKSASSKGDTLKFLVVSGVVPYSD